MLTKPPLLDETAQKILSAVQRIKNKLLGTSSTAITPGSAGASGTAPIIQDDTGRDIISALNDLGDAVPAETQYLSGVTSNIQTQLDAKQATITGGATTIASSNLTASRALVSNSSGKVAVSAVTSTELGYLDGVTSAIQTQLDAKQASGSYKTTQTAVSDPSASGSGITYIASISQNTNGVITATKSTVRDASASQSGVVSTGAQTLAGVKTFTSNIIAGSSAQDTFPTAGIQIHDVRSVAHTPAGPDKAANFFFSNNTMPDSKWWSGIIVRGWEGGYSSWELVGPSHNTDQRTTPLYVRTSNINSAWGSWRKIYDSSNLPTLSELGAAASSHTHSYAGSSSAGGAATNAATTADTSNSLYLVGVTSSATTTLKRDTSITMTGGSLYATTYYSTNTTSNGAVGSYMRFSNAPTANAVYAGLITAYSNYSGRMYLRQYSGSDSARTSYYETYRLPQCAASKTGSTNYDIHTTKQTRVFTGTCSTAAATVAKAVTLAGDQSYSLTKGDIIFVTFSNTNTGAVADLTLNINSTGAKPIKRWYNGGATSNIVSAGYLAANMTIMFYYDGTNWVANMPYNTNTTYTSKDAASGGTDVSLVTTGEKYTWNSKTSNTGTVTSVRVQATSPVTSSTSTAQTSSLNTTIALADGYGDTKNPYASKTANYVLAAPNGSAGAPSFRALVAADIPSLNTSKLTAGTLGIARGGTGVTAATGSAMQPVYLSSSGLAACRAPSSLYSGTLSSGSTTLTNAFNYNAIIVMGLPGTSTYTTKATVTIPTALITTTASRWGIANESYGVAFTLTKSGSNITLAWAAGTGSITNVYGVI